MGLDPSPVNIGLYHPACGRHKWMAPKPIQQITKVSEFKNYLI